MARQSHRLHEPPTILLTRPAEQSARFAGELRQALGPVKVLIAPLMAVEFLAPTIPDRPFAGLILTSETGAAAAARIAESGAGLPELAYCVGDRTAAAAQAFGFKAHSSKGNVADLVDYLLVNHAAGPLLHICGRHRHGGGDSSLKLAGIETVFAVAYAQHAQDLGEEAKALLRGSAAVLVPLFSTRSAALFAEQVANSGVTAPLWVVAISDAAAGGLAPLVPARIRISRKPDGAAMIDAIADFIKDAGSS